MPSRPRFFVFWGRAAPAWARREHVHVGLTAASLLPTPPAGAARPPGPEATKSGEFGIPPTWKRFCRSGMTAILVST